MFKQGEIYFVNLEPTEGHEQGRSRPCVVVSNDQFNALYNTVFIAPISSQLKYRTEPKFLNSYLFQPVDAGTIHGTILLQHTRAIDMNSRKLSNSVAFIGNTPQMGTIIEVLQAIFEK